MTRFRIATLIAFLAGPLPVLAQGTEVGFGSIQADTDAPVEVTSDDLSVNNGDGTALFSGNVIVGQGDMRLTAPRVLVVYNEGRTGIARMEARGGVTLVSGEEAAEAQQADYDVEAATVVMTGNVLLTQGLNALTSDRMVVNLEDGTARMTGRVKTVIQQQPGEDSQ